MTVFPSRYVAEGPPTSEHFRYLLLMTNTLENLAYRPAAQDSRFLPAYAPSVLELIDEVTNRPPHTWIWKRTALDDEHEFGPLLVDISQVPELLDHAVAEWMPVDAAIAIDSDLPLVELADHFSSMIQFGIRGAEINNHSLDPNHLDAWLDALAPDNREAWLGPMSRLGWRINWGPAFEWRQLERSPTVARLRVEPMLMLQQDEVHKLAWGLHDYFVLSLAHKIIAMPQYTTRSLSEIRPWIEALLPQLRDLNFANETVAGQFVLLVAAHMWLMSNQQATAIYTNLEESPEARLRQMQALVLNKEPHHD